MTNSRRACTLALFSLLTVAALPATAQRADADARIVNGLQSQDFPTTGALLYSQNINLPITPDNAGTWCSGVLIGCQTFLTAAHCVAGDNAASHYQVYLQNGGIRTVASITRHPEYTTNLWSKDVAIVKLTSPVEGVQPTPINTTHDIDALGVGLTGTIAGFGRTGGGNDYGIKRFGTIVTADCNTSLTGGFGNDVLVCWNYDAIVGPPGTDSNSCNGDSGGPLFMDFAGVSEVVGLTSAGVNGACGIGDHSWDSNLFAHAAFLTAQLGADSTNACGTEAPVGNPATTVQKNSGVLDVGNPDDSFTVNVGASAALLRVTVNGLNNGFNANIFVKHGDGASAANFDCKSDGLSVYGDCTLANPASGTWSVFVQAAAGSGDYQVTSTVFGATAIACGDAGLNGDVLASDALVTLKVAVGSLQRPRCIADVNDSGTISTSDALLVLKSAVSQAVTLHCPPCS